MKTLKSSTLCKSCGSFFGSIQYDYQHVHSRRFSTSDQWQENLICRTNDNEKTSEPSEKTCQVGDGTNSNLVPGEFIKFCPYDYSPRKETLVSPESDNETESEKTVQRDDKNSKVEEVDSGHEEKSSQTSEGIISSPRESRPDNTSVGIVSQEKIFSSKKAREKWRNALTKCKQNKKQFSKRNTTNGQDQRARKKIRNRELNKKFESPSENSDLEIHDIEMMEKEFQNSKIFRENDFKELNYSTKNGEAEAERDHEKNEILMEPEENSREKLENDHFSPIKIECEEKESSGVAHDAGSSTSNFHEKNLDLTEHDLGNDSDLREKGDETDKENLENGEKEKIKDDHSTTENSTPGCENLMKINDKSSTESSSCTDTRKIKTEISEMVSDFPPEIQKELQNLYDNITTYEEVEAKKSKAPFARRRSFDSSFDSENDYALGRQPQLVQVEVEINSAPAKVDSENSENIFADDSEGVGGNSVQNSETSDSDDDDVIVR